MNAAAASLPEFGTGLRARIEHRPGLLDRLAPPPSRDLVRLCSPEPRGRAPRPRARALVSRDLAVRGAWGAFAA